VVESGLLRSDVARGSDKVILTDAERAKFAEYLEADIQSSEIIIRQMEGFRGLPSALVARMSAEVAAMKIVARRLRNTTGERIEGA
jgi:hypothetical protein